MMCDRTFRLLIRHPIIFSFFTPLQDLTPAAGSLIPLFIFFLLSFPSTPALAILSMLAEYGLTNLAGIDFSFPELLPEDLSGIGEDIGVCLICEFPACKWMYHCSGGA